jgi:hypothetical protein
LGIVLMLSITSLPTFNFNLINRFINSHETLVGAFLGALAAPLSIVITDIVRERRTRDHERRKIHYNRLVNLQTELNIMRATLDDNLGVIATIITSNNLGVPTLQRPVQVAYDTSVLGDLYDIQLVNKLNQLYYVMRRFNLDMANLTNVLDRLAEEKFSGRITADEYKREVGIINPQVQQLHDTLSEELEFELLDAIAYVRICSNTDASQEMQDRLQRMLKGRANVSQDDLLAMREIIKLELAEDQRTKDDLRSRENI